MDWTSSTNKHWGEFDEDSEDESVLQNVNFNPIIELGMQNIPEIPITTKSAPIELPKPNLITHSIQLHGYLRQLSAILDHTEKSGFKAARIDPLSIPPIPAEPPMKLEHETKGPINFLPKEYCDFSLGKGPVILPFTPESHQRALQQCAALAIGQIGFATCTNTALNAVTDMLDWYMTNMCKLLRIVVDKDASGLKSGYPDAISKVLADLQVGNLHEFYQNRVVKYNAKLRRQCEQLKAECDALSVGDIAPELKLEEVPELHFPAALDAFAPSLESGFQMLQSLEQEQLHGLDLLESVVSDDIKVEPEEFTQADTPRLSSLSPSAKKKRK